MTAECCESFTGTDVRGETIPNSRSCRAKTSSTKWNVTTSNRQKVGRSRPQRTQRLATYSHDVEDCQVSTLQTSHLHHHQHHQQQQHQHYYDDDDDQMTQRTCNHSYHAITVISISARHDFIIRTSRCIAKCLFCCFYCYNAFVIVFD